MPDMIRWGSLAAPLHVQMGVDRRVVREWQRDADAITRLGHRGLLPEDIGRVLYDRLGKRIRECGRG